MCVHKPIARSPADLNKMSEYKDSMQTDIEILSEFSSECCYYDQKQELVVYQNDLSIMHLNIRSLLLKQNDLIHLMKDPFVDVCLLNETWLNDQNKNIVSIKGYDLVSHERIGKKGGGVGILLASYLSYKERSDLEFDYKSFEICVVELRSNTGSIILVSLYRPPNSNERSFLCEYKLLLSNLQKEKNKRVIIGCDHNFDFLKADHHNGTRLFLDCNIDNGSWPIITKPSRITKNSATLIDNIFVNKEVKDDYDCGLLLDDISDHFPCYIVLRDCKVKHRPKQYVTCRKITPKTTKNIKDKLLTLPLNQIARDQSMNANIAFSTWHSRILETIDNIAPYETVPLKSKYLNKEPWLPVGLLKSIKKQKKLYQNILKKGSTDSDFYKYKNYRNTLTKVKRSCKIDNYKPLSQKAYRYAKLCKNG